MYTFFIPKLQKYSNVSEWFLILWVLITWQVQINKTVLQMRHLRAGSSIASNFVFFLVSLSAWIVTIVNISKSANDFIYFFDKPNHHIIWHVNSHLFLLRSLNSFFFWLLVHNSFFSLGTPFLIPFARPWVSKCSHVLGFWTKTFSLFYFTLSPENFFCSWSFFGLQAPN